MTFLLAPDVAASPPHPDDLAALGATIVDSEASSYTHFVTSRLRPSSLSLFSIARAIPIVAPPFISACLASISAPERPLPLPSHYIPQPVSAWANVLGEPNPPPSNVFAPNRLRLRVLARLRLVFAVGPTDTHPVAAATTATAVGTAAGGAGIAVGAGSGLLARVGGPASAAGAAIRALPVVNPTVTADIAADLGAVCDGGLQTQRAGVSLGADAACDTRLDALLSTATRGVGGTAAARRVKADPDEVPSTSVNGTRLGRLSARDDAAARVAEVLRGSVLVIPPPDHLPPCVVRMVPRSVWAAIGEGEAYDRVPWGRAGRPTEEESDGQSRRARSGVRGGRGGGGPVGAGRGDGFPEADTDGGVVDAIAAAYALALRYCGAHVAITTTRCVTAAIVFAERRRLRVQRVGGQRGDARAGASEASEVQADGTSGDETDDGASPSASVGHEQRTAPAAAARACRDGEAPPRTGARGECVSLSLGRASVAPTGSDSDATDVDSRDQAVPHPSADKHLQDRPSEHHGTPGPLCPPGGGYVYNVTRHDSHRAPASALPTLKSERAAVVQATAAATKCAPDGAGEQTIRLASRASTDTRIVARSYVVDDSESDGPGPNALRERASQAAPSPLGGARVKTETKSVQAPSPRPDVPPPPALSSSRNGGAAVTSEPLERVPRGGAAESRATAADAPPEGPKLEGSATTAPPKVERKPRIPPAREAPPPDADAMAMHVDEEDLVALMGPRVAAAMAARGTLVGVAVRPVRILGAAGGALDGPDRAHAAGVVGPVDGAPAADAGGGADGAAAGGAAAPDGGDDAASLGRGWSHKARGPAQSGADAAVVGVGWLSKSALRAARAGGCRTTGEAAGASDAARVSGQQARRGHGTATALSHGNGAARAPVAPTHALRAVALGAGRAAAHSSAIAATVGLPTGLEVWGGAAAIPRAGAASKRAAVGGASTSAPAPKRRRGATDA